jgi:hypothetical protein
MSDFLNEAQPFEVAIVVASTEPDIPKESGIPGYDESWGRTRRQQIGDGSVIIKKGEEALRIATEAIANQIAITARRIGDAIERESLSSSQPGHMTMQAVEVSFGVTLTAGVQAYFTAQGSSSVQVTITLGR